MEEGSALIVQPLSGDWRAVTHKIRSGVLALRGQSRIAPQITLVRVVRIPLLVVPLATEKVSCSTAGVVGSAA